MQIFSFGFESVFETHTHSQVERRCVCVCATAVELHFQIRRGFSSFSNGSGGEILRLI